MTPRSRLKKVRGKTIVCDAASNVAMEYLYPIFEVRTKIKFVKSFKKKNVYSKESNAFSKLRKIARPGRFFATV